MTVFWPAARVMNRFRLTGTSPATAFSALATCSSIPRKVRRPRAEARDKVLAWAKSYRTAPTTHAAMANAVGIAAAHRLSLWDSAILAVAAESGCQLLLSEDMQDGFTWNSVTVVTPFAAPRHPLLEALLQPEAEC